MNLNHQAFRVITVVALALTLIGCQPDPESRVRSAKKYADDGDFPAAVIEIRNALTVQPKNIEARLLLADLSFRLADYPSAEIEYGRALELNANSIETWIGFGRSILAQNRVTEVIDRVFPSLEELGHNDASFSLQGDVLLALRNVEKAERAYESALQINPQNAAALVGLAAVADANGDTGASREFMKRAVSTDTDNSRVWVSKGNFHAKLNELDAATRAFEQAILIESETSPTGILLVARVNLVALLLDAKQIPAVRTEINKLEAEFRGHPIIHFLKGRLALGDGELNLARSELQKYVSLFPGDRRGQAVLGVVHFSQNDLLQAEMYLSQAVRADVGGDSARRLLAETQLRLNKPDLALTWLEESFSQNSDDPLLLSMLGRAQAGLGNSKAALDYYEQGIASESADPKLLLSIAAGLLAMGEEDRAVQVLESIPDDFESGHNREVLLISAHLSRGDSKKSIGVTKKLVSKYPGDASVHAIAGTVHFYLDESDTARDYFREALRLDSGNIPAMYGMSRYFLRQGDDSASKAELLKILDVQPSYIPALAGLADAVRSERDRDELEQLLSAAIDAAPDELGVRVVAVTFANASGDYARALVIVEDATAEFPSEPALRHGKGIALYESGNIEEGLIALASAGAAAPNNAVFQFDHAIARFRSNDYAEALRVVRIHNQLRPKSFEGVALEFNSLVRSGLIHEARTFLDGSAAEIGSDNRINILYGDLAFADDRPGEAVRYFELAAEKMWTKGVLLRLVAANTAAGSGEGVEHLRRWVAEHPEDDEIQLMYGQALQVNGDRSNAVLAYETLLGTDQNNAIALNNLAWEYALQGREEAIELAERAHRLRPENGSITDTLGWIYYQHARYEQSLSMLVLAESQSPQSLEIKYHLASVLLKTGSEQRAKVLLTSILADGAAFPSRADAEKLATQL